MRRIKLYRTALLVLFLSFLLSDISAQYQQVYWVSTSNLISGMFGRCNNNWVKQNQTCYGCNYDIGFSWDDVLSPAYKIVSATIEFRLGYNYNNVSGGTMFLNSYNQGWLNTSNKGTTSCSGSTFMQDYSISVNIDHYNLGGLNTYIVAPGGPLGFNRSITLNWNIAKVTVEYEIQTASNVSINGNSTTSSVIKNQASIIDSNITVSSNGTIDGFSVSIVGSYQPGDLLEYNTATGGALPTGISVANFDTVSRNLVFKGVTSSANWQQILRNVTLKTTAAACSPESRKIAFVTGSRVLYNLSNGHFYRAISLSTNWTIAKEKAEKSSYYGKRGYLATITSPAENSFITYLIGQNSWIGCSDDYYHINSTVGYTKYANQTASEGQWHWVTGPEKGIQMRTGNSGPNGISSIYQNWNSIEPNNVGNEPFGHIYGLFGGGPTGTWNDFNDTRSIGRVVEYGDMPEDMTSVSNPIFVKNIKIVGSVSGSIQDGNISVCNGSNSTALNLVNMVSGGSVVRWEYSLDDFITAGIPINSTSTSLTVSNLTETTYYRAVVNVSTCSSLPTSSTRISVVSPIAGNVISNKSTICTGGTTELTLTGNSGSVVRWERSASSTFASGITTINKTTSILIDTLSSVGTYYYRAVVQQFGCGAAVNSNGYPVTVVTGTNPIGGMVTSTSACSGTNSLSLSLNNYSGNISKWQFSIDGGIVWNDIANTSNVIGLTNIVNNQKYRAIVASSNAACGSVSSSSGDVTIYGTNIVRWDGTVSKNSNNAANWCGGIPKTGQDVLINDLAPNDLLLEQNREWGTINMNYGPRTIELANFNLKCTGIKNLISNNYLITNGTGKLTMRGITNTPIVFPVGNKKNNPLVITNRTEFDDDFSVRVIDSVHKNGFTGGTIISPHVKATWDISKTNPNNSGSGIDFRLNWDTTQEIKAPNKPITYTFRHYNNLIWELATGTSNSPTAAGTRKSMLHTDYNGTFSPFFVGDIYAFGLPVEFIGMTANCLPDNKVQLDWSTASEKNASSFEIQSSFNAMDWNTLGHVKAVGNTSEVSKYSFIDDKSPVGQRLYYRLKQIDIEENFELLPTITHYCENNEDKSNAVYPNPSNGKFNVLFNNTLNEDLTISVSDVFGKIIYLDKLQAKRGFNQLDLDLKFAATGTYILNIFSSKNNVMKHTLYIKK